MKIVILGYTGFIGKSILESLAKKNSLKLVCVGRNLESKPFKYPKVKYIKWDFENFDNSKMVFLKNTDIVINCVGKIINDQNNIQKVNVTFIKKFLNYININKIKIRLLHLSSISVYGENKINLNSYKFISENSPTKVSDIYSKSKLQADLLIQNNINKKLSKNFSYTILRISNVFGGEYDSNLFKFIKMTLKYNLWIRCSDNVLFNFINIEDVTEVVKLVIAKLKVSKNKTYIVSDDCKQNLVYKKNQYFQKKKIKIIKVSTKFIKFFIYFMPLPKKIFNFFKIISNRTTYSNKKIKKELKYKPQFSIYKFVRNLNEKKN